MPTTQVIFPADSTLLPSDYFGQFDALITDPPYSSHTHASAVSSQSKVRGVRKRDFGFDPLNDATRAVVARAAAGVRRWSVVYSDIESTHYLREAARGAGAVYIRTLSWIRWSMPQLSGDRPPSGREDLLFFHSAVGEDPDPCAEDIALFYGSKPGRKAWNGPGNLTHLAHKCLRGEGKHKAEKPLDQALDLVEWFTSPGETVLDLFAGAGTIGVACALLDRNFVGFELDTEWARKAQTRIDAAREGHLSERDRERVRRWCDRTGR